MENDRLNRLGIQQIVLQNLRLIHLRATPQVQPYEIQAIQDQDLILGLAEE